MKTAEQINKIEAVVLYILNKFEDGTDYIKLYKIMYFAQRDFLSSFGREILPETFKARKFGPVPALTNKVIKQVEDSEVNDYPDLANFEKGITVSNKIVRAIKKSDVDYISVKERKCLDKWFDFCKDKDSLSELSALSHDKAYQAVIDRMSSDPQQDRMTRIDIAKGGGASEKILNYIHEHELIESALA
ncbi:MAG: SocA family protein [Bacteroidales bacterium]|jgi:hypothetical protein|nr:SocA family protein [Bacteroidales bacterium]MBR2201691.1 SocA family protein [Bacteroidales bacterium]